MRGYRKSRNSENGEARQGKVVDAGCADFGTRRGEHKVGC
jgi:hypothetical protein